MSSTGTPDPLPDVGKDLAPLIAASASLRTKRPRASDGRPIKEITNQTSPTPHLFQLNNRTLDLMK